MQNLNLGEKLDAISKILITNNTQDPEHKKIVTSHIMDIVKN